MIERETETWVAERARRLADPRSMAEKMDESRRRSALELVTCVDGPFAEQTWCPESARAVARAREHLALVGYEITPTDDPKAFTAIYSKPGVLP